MKKTKLFAFILAVTACLGFTSCLSEDNNEETITTNCPGYINAIYDPATGKTVYTDGVSYELKVNYTNSTAEIKLTGLKTPDGYSYTPLTLSNLKFVTNSRGWMEFNEVDLMPSSGAGLANLPVFTRFHIEMLNRTVGNYYVPCLDISYTINDKYTVHSVASGYIEVGTTLVNATMPDGSKFSYTADDNNAPSYTINLDGKTQKATVYITGAKFAEQMPAMNMKFKDIPYSIDASGYVRFSSPGFTPYRIMSDNQEVPDENHPITNFAAMIMPNTGTSISFVCTITTAASEDGTRPESSVAYDVNFASKYPQYSNTPK